jgi:hypothetical protein
MYPLHSDGLSTEFLSRYFMFLSSVPSEYAQSFSTTLSFAPSREFFGRNYIQIASFGPAAPSIYWRQGFGPSNCFFRASSAFNIFEAGLWSLELLLLGQQRLQYIRGRALVPRIASFGPAAPSRYSKQDFGPLNCFFRASSSFNIFEAGLWSLELLISGQQRLQYIRGRALVP